VSAFRLVKMVNGNSGSVVAMSLGEGEWNPAVGRHDFRPFPGWVYRDTTLALTCQLQRLYAAHFNKPLTLTRLEGEGEGEGEGEQDLSFQVASELFRRREERISILSENSTSVRLFRCIEKLSKSSEDVLSCSSCSRPLARRKHMINVVGTQGACGVYTNPHGFVHSTVTVNELISTAAVFVAGLPTIKDTWFPGYAWQILYCRPCHAHLGWRFSKDSGEEFYGFRHESIVEGEEGNVDVVEDIEDEVEFEDALEQGDEGDEIEDEEEDEEFEDVAHEEND
jgi:Yippee zinc-binding/DNA-binding /Mis18, centromere assembly